MCKALAGARGSKTVVTDWLSGNTEAIEVALWLTMLPCVVSRGRFGDAWMSMTVSFGSEAEGAARASLVVAGHLAANSELAHARCNAPRHQQIMQKGPANPPHTTQCTIRTKERHNGVPKRPTATAGRLKH
eukprot:scaffold19288_cov142-Isochrysis_galbana.AAC.4